MRFDLLGFFALEKRLDRIERILMNLIRQEHQIMTVGQDLLDAVTAEDTKIDSVITLLNGLAAQGVIPPAVLAQIKNVIQGSEDKLDAAIAANTPPPPPTP